MKKLFRFLSPKFQTLFSEYPVKMVPRYGHGKPPHGELYTIIDENRDEYRTFLEQTLELKSAIHDINKLEQESDLSSPGWNNGMLPGLDIVGIYAMLAIKKPNRYVEVGSGNSTKVAYRSKMDNSLSTEITSIDPMPRAEIDNLADKIIRQPFENIDYSEILGLNAGDILFIDNSHRILPNSDAMVFFMEILPKLKKGVIVHIHDIYLPYDYPQFMCDRFYTEQYGLAIYLLANPEKYATILPNYFISEDKELSELISPMWDHPNLEGVEQHGGSFWLEIR